MWEVMHSIRSATITLLIVGVAATVACTSHGGGRSENIAPRVPAKLVIQPYKGMSGADVEVVRRGIAELYSFEVEVLPERDLPASAYYAPRKRYRAAMLLEDLETFGAPTSKVLGLTNVDISVTNGEIDDWGIFGFGQVGGKPSVVSGFRLGREGIDQALYEARLQKVANHEIGHTLGLDHCDQEGCLMQDARGKIATIDRMTGTLCSRCVAKIAPHSVLRTE